MCYFTCIKKIHEFKTQYFEIKVSFIKSLIKITVFPSDLFLVNFDRVIEENALKFVDRQPALLYDFTKTSRTFRKNKFFQFRFTNE